MGETLIYPLVKLKTKSLIHAVSDTLPGVGLETICDKLAELKFEALVDNLADWPVELQAETTTKHQLV